MSNQAIHVYGQHSYHDDVHIVGNKKSLIALRNAIDKAITSKTKSEKFVAFTNDGEGFDLEVIFCDEEDKFSRLVSPYFDELSRDNSDNLLFPWQIKIKGVN